jgi:hypothetical protein
MTDKELDEFIYVGENKFIELAMIFGDAWASTAIQIAAEHRAMLTQPEKEWVSLTLEEIQDILDCGRGGLIDIKKAEQKLKEKNS